MTDPNQPSGYQPTSEQPGAQQPPSFDKPSAQPGAVPPPPEHQGFPPPPQQPPPAYPPPPHQHQPPPGYPPPPPQHGLPQAPPAYYQPPPVGPGGMVLDPRSGLYLPPGVELASHGRRIGSFFLRFVLFIVTLGIGYIIWGLILWNQGTTPVLKVLGMKCWLVNEGRVPGFWRMALRNIIGFIVDGILSIITALISFIMFLATAKRQSLHDLVGGTTVVYDPHKVLG